MNTNEFKRHLASIHNVLNSNQRHLYEETEKVEPEEVEEVEEVEVEDLQELEEKVVLEFLNSYFGGELTENTSDEDITKAIVELNVTCEAVNNFFNVK